MAVCTSIEVIEKNPTAGDLLRVTIDNTTTALWFFDYNESLQYLNKDVIVEYRQDVYKGELQQFIKTFVIPTTVNTLEKKDNIKLYIDQTDNNANMSFSDVAPGEKYIGAILFCVHSEYKSSPNAIWQELIIRDKSMHTAKLRVFDYENSLADFSGQYVMADISRNQYGFQSDMVTPVSGEMQRNPEIDIAEQYIKNYFAANTVALDFITKNNLFGNLEEVVDYEKGYALMRLAMELAMVDGMDNITKDINLNAIGEALLCTYGHYCRKSILSKEINSITLAMPFMFEDRKLVLQLLDKNLEDKPKEAYVMANIQKTVETILEVRKGTI